MKKCRTKELLSSNKAAMFLREKKRALTWEPKGLLEGQRQQKFDRRCRLAKKKSLESSKDRDECT